ncbi:MAG: sulfatase/phosphatase domain-containing protein, partial [Verrucomicrobiota bacterium]
TFCSTLCACAPPGTLDGDTRPDLGRFYNPHCPYVAPKRYFDLYPLDTITVPDLDEAKKDLEDVPAMAIQRDSKRWPYYFDDISEDQARRCKQAYYASISFLDAQVGRLMDALHELGLMEKTIIVFWSDHGYFLGEKGLWYKRKAFERSARAPLLIAGPGIDQGTTITQPVELLDLYPTLADFCRLPTPENLEGLSLRPLLTGNPEAWTKPAALTQIWHNPKAFGYSLRTERYRYTEWMHGEAGSELYDHQVDGDEVTNLAMNPAFEEERKRLSAQLRTLIGDQPSQKSP